MYTKSALKRNQKSDLEKILLEVLYVCGDLFADVKCDDDSILNIIHTRANLSCNSSIEIPLEIPPSALFVLVKKI